jgi:hypothetical protein
VAFNGSLGSRREVVSKQRGLLVADVPGWAFDVNEYDMEEYLPEFEWGHHYIRDGGRMLPPGRWDFLFLPWHRWIPWYPYSRIMGSLRSRWFDAARPGATSEADLDLISRCQGFHVVTRDNKKDLDIRKCDNVVYLTNPVNMRRFNAPTNEREIVCCWTGNADHASSASKDVKGFYSVVVPACSDARRVLRVAEYNSCRRTPAEMPDFYKTASVCLCASLYEGASNSVMEAMASGLAVIATDCGNHREMRDSQLGNIGDTGIILVDRTREAFADAIGSLTPERVRDMGQINREEIAERWSWDAWRDRYLSYFRMAE